MAAMITNAVITVSRVCWSIRFKPARLLGPRLRLLQSGELSGCSLAELLRQGLTHGLAIGLPAGIDRRREAFLVPLNRAFPAFKGLRRLIFQFLCPALGKVGTFI